MRDRLEYTTHLLPLTEVHGKSGYELYEIIMLHLAKMVITIELCKWFNSDSGSECKEALKLAIQDNPWLMWMFCVAHWWVQTV